MIIATYGTPDELYHHGIKGQKWGVRRYRKLGGGLTEYGKNRLMEAHKIAQEKNDKLDPQFKLRGGWANAMRTLEKPNIFGYVEQAKHWYDNNGVVQATLLENSDSAIVKGEKWLKEHGNKAFWNYDKMTIYFEDGQERTLKNHTL